MVIVVNAGKDAIAKIDAIREEKEYEMQEKIALLESEYESKKRELEESHVATLKSLKIERDRESEEYIYNQKREREISRALTYLLI